MRVGLLHYSGPPVVGGVEQTLAQHARQLAAAGHEPVLIVGEGRAPAAGIELRVLPRLQSRHPEVIRVKQELDRGKVSPRFGALQEQIRRDLVSPTAGLDALIVHNVLSLHKNLPLTSALWDLHRRRTWPLLIGWHHDLAWDRPEYAAELHPGHPWDLLRQAWPGVVPVTVSEAQRLRFSHLTGSPPETIAVIPPGVDPADFGRWGPTTRRIYEALALDRADLLLLLPSRVTRRKNIEQAIAITAALAARSGADVRLIVTGPPGPHNPSNRTYLDELADRCRQLRMEHAVHLLYRLAPEAGETLDDRTVADLFDVADALLLTSTAEGFGIPILEAGLARLPVFCVDIPPFRETGADEVTYLRPDESPESAAQEILDSLERDPRHRLRRRVLRDYSWARLVRDRLLPLLEKMPHA